VIHFIDLVVEEGEPGAIVELRLFDLDEEVLVELVIFLQEIAHDHH